MKTRAIPLLAALILTSALAGCPADPEAGFTSPTGTREPLVVFLVRHAEKVDSSSDPDLSPAGLERAATLAEVLHSADLEHVHSSDYTRTRDTAAPTAADHELEVELYNAGDLDGLTEELLATGGRHLVVGHSNTTPAMVNRLGGDPGPAIDEHVEYDRLYMVTMGPDGYVHSALIRYGSAPEAEPEE
jgi:2,3-bisphosphoglycerate-dependent phosphoglycerate mutase